MKRVQKNYLKNHGLVKIYKIINQFNDHEDKKFDANDYEVKKCDTNKVRTVRKIQNIIWFIN